MLGPNSSTKLPHEQQENTPIGVGLAIGTSTSGMEPLLNIDEAARIIGRAHWTLRQDIKSGRLKCVRIGRRIMIEPSEIRKLIDLGRGRSAK